MSDTHLLIKTLRGASAQTCDWQSGPVAVELLDRRTGGQKVLTSNGQALWFGAALSADGRFVAFDDFDTGLASVMDVATGETVLSFESKDGLVRAINQDGSLLAYGDPIEIRDVRSGEVVSTYTGHDGISYYATFDASGTGVYSVGVDNKLHHWDAADGSADLRAPRDRPAAHLGHSRRRRGRRSVGRDDLRRRHAAPR